MNNKTKPFKITYYQHDETTLLVSTIINATNKKDALNYLTRLLNQNSVRYKIIDIEEVKLCY